MTTALENLKRVKGKDGPRRKSATYRMASLRLSENEMGFPNLSIAYEGLGDPLSRTQRRVK